MEFDWDSGNLNHIARHGVTREEAEQAVVIEPLEAEVQLDASENRVICLGRTNSGRLLTVIFTERHGKTRVVTAYDMTKEQQQMYFEEQ